MWSSIGLCTEKTATKDIFETGTLENIVLEDSMASESDSLS